MNIFVLDEDPQLAAIYHCDKHVIKMILESTQLLLMAFYRNNMILTQKQALEQKELVAKIFKDFPRRNNDGSANPYKVTHMNHPCTIWASESKKNFEWLLELLGYLHEEYYYRYSRYKQLASLTHACHPIFMWITDNYKNLSFLYDFRTPFVQAMPDLHRGDDPVLAYRKYYIAEKSGFAKWTNRDRPVWFKITRSYNFLLEKKWYFEEQGYRWESIKLPDWIQLEIVEIGRTKQLYVHSRIHVNKLVKLEPRFSNSFSDREILKYFSDRIKSGWL